MIVNSYTEPSTSQSLRYGGADRPRATRHQCRLLVRLLTCVWIFKPYFSHILEFSATA